MLSATLSPRVSTRDGLVASSRPRLALLDGLRFFAAFAVLMFHYTARENLAWGMPVAEAFPTLHEFTAVGFFGVDLFFVISGFVIVMSVWGRDLPKFVGSRFGRLMPAYWAGVALTSVLLLFVWPEGKDVSVTQSAANLTMLQSALGVGHIDGVYWTLWVELRFYLLIGVFVLIGMNRQRLLAFAAVWPAVAAIADRSGADFVATLLISDYAPMFAAGIAIFMLTRDRRNPLIWLVLLGNTAIAAAWVGPHDVRQVLDTTGVALQPFTVSVILTVCVAVVVLIALTPLSRVSAAWLVPIGALTYPLYLIHEYWGWWIITELHDLAPTPVVLGATFVIMMAAAWAINRWIERPFGPKLAKAVEHAARSLKPERTTVTATGAEPHHPDAVRRHVSGADHSQHSGPGAGSPPRRRSH